MEIIDIGINLLHKSFNTDRDEQVEKARKAGVTRMIITGTSERNSVESKKYAEKYTGVLYSTAGVHPHDAKSFTKKTLPSLEKLLSSDTVVAVGECGLDFNRDFSPRPLQEKVFEDQIGLAAKTGKPLFLHERDAHRRFTEILSAHRDMFDKAVVHCFTGSIGEARVYLDMGFHIGITGWICDEKHGRHLNDVVRMIPIDRLMIETDAPFLIPRSLPNFRSHNRNKPEFLVEVLKYISKIYGKPEKEIADATLRTTVDFFCLK